MSRNRYGRIYHSDYNYINLRFESLDKRRIFEAKFNAYHADHDHDGEAPRFEEVAASVIGNMESTTVHDAHSVSIDGYATYEIEEYHNRDSWTRRYRYEPPTCCVAPVISIDRTFLASDTLERHELSSIFGDMPDEDYQSLLESAERDGFMDPVIRLLGTSVLDGWNRYRAAKELNLIRKLRFHQWDEKDEGDPRAFVYARNMERRHQEKAVRAQIAVAFNERFGHGGDRKSIDESSRQNGNLKSREQLAADTGVSTRTIDRAIVIEKEGKSEAVISGEKKAGEVLKEWDVAKLVKRKKQVIKNIWDMRVQAARDYTGDADTELNEYLTLPELEKGFAKSYESYRGPFESAMKRIDAAVSFQKFQERCMDVDEYGNAKFNTEDLEKEYRAVMTYSGDLRNWQREDWSPDTNWILPLIEAKKKQSQSVTADTEDKSPSVSDLWDKIEKNTQAIRAAYTEVYQKGAVSVSEMFTAGISYYNLPKEGLELSLDNPTGGYEDKKRLTRIEGVTARMLLDFTESRVKAGWIRKCISGEAKIKMLWEQIASAISTWKSARKGKGVGHASKSMFIEATKCFLSEFTRDSETDVDLLEKLLDVLNEVHGPGYTFERFIKMQCDGADIWKKSDADELTPDDTDEDPEKSDALDKFKTQKADLYALIEGTPLISVKDEFGFENADKARHGVMVAAHKAYDVSEDLLWSDQAIEDLSAEEIRRITGLYYLMAQDLTASRADWVVKLYQEVKIPVPAESEVSESTPNDNLVALAGSLMKDFDAHFEKLEVTGEAAYMQLFEKAAAHYSFDLTCFLYVTEMYDSVDYKEAQAFWDSLEQPQRHAWMNLLMSMQDDLKNRTNWAAGIDESCQPLDTLKTETEPTEQEDTAADTSLADLNLPSLKGILDTLVDTVGQVEDPSDRDDLSCAIYDVFCEQFEGVTEREQLSILLECAQQIVSESESYSFVRFIEGSDAGENESPAA